MAIPGTTAEETTVIGREGEQDSTFSSSASKAAGATAAKIGRVTSEIVKYAAAHREAHGVDALGIDARDLGDVVHLSARELHVVDV